MITYSILLSYVHGKFKKKFFSFLTIKTNTYRVFYCISFKLLFYIIEFMCCIICSFCLENVSLLFTTKTDLRIFTVSLLSARYAEKCYRILA